SATRGVKPDSRAHPKSCCSYGTIDAHVSSASSRRARRSRRASGWSTGSTAQTGSSAMSSDRKPETSVGGRTNARSSRPLASPAARRTGACPGGAVLLPPGADPGLTPAPRARDLGREQMGGRPEEAGDEAPALPPRSLPHTLDRPVELLDQRARLVEQGGTR